MKINLLKDYLSMNGLTATWIIDKDFGTVTINDKNYKVCLSISDNIPDDLCYSIVINRKRYRFGDGDI